MFKSNIEEIKNRIKQINNDLKNDKIKDAMRQVGEIIKKNTYEAIKTGGASGYKLYNTGNFMRQLAKINPVVKIEGDSIKAYFGTISQLDKIVRPGMWVERVDIDGTRHRFWVKQGKWGYWRAIEYGVTGERVSSDPDYTGVKYKFSGEYLMEKQSVGRFHVGHLKKFRQKGINWAFTRKSVFLMKRPR